MKPITTEDCSAKLPGTVSKNRWNFDDTAPLFMSDLIEDFSMRKMGLFGEVFRRKERRKHIEKETATGQRKVS